MNYSKIFWIDLFSGAGGTTTGIHLAGIENVRVVACVNHDLNAIESHKANHPNCIHFVEDIRDFKVVLALEKLVIKLRKENPECFINIWASLECTNYSKAKGGLPRDADSRTLAYSLYPYIEHLKPDYIYIENVREFMAWGPLDSNGKPVSKLNGQDYISWTKDVQKYGYDYDKQILDSANFGAYQTRERYFGQFAKSGLPIRWPEQTHTKKPVVNGLFKPLEKWKAVRDVLDLEDEGKSIFNRKKPLVEATLERIYAGLVKFVANGETEFIQKHFSGRPAGKVIGTSGPTGSITTSGNQSIVRACFLSHYYGNGFTTSIDEPCPTLRTKDSVAKIRTVFLDQQYGNSKPVSIDRPAGTITVNPKQKLINVKGWILDPNFRNVGRSLDGPSGTILACRKHYYLVNPQFNSAGSSIEYPCFTLIARMDKRPPSIVQVDIGRKNWIIFESDIPVMRKIKIFMVAFGLSDIKMRMLKIPELLQIQGFPEDYILKGTITEQKKYIGNAVATDVAAAIARVNAIALNSIMSIAV